MNRLPRILAIAGLGLLLSAARSVSAEDGVDWFQATGPRAWLVNYDPTLIGRRVYSETSYESDRNGDYTFELANSARYAFSPAQNIALGAQFELPVKWARHKGTVANGLSDFEWRAGGVLRLNDRLRWGAALNVKVPTAIGEQLGSPWTELRPISALSWDVLDWLNLGLFASYYFTPANTGPSGTNKIEVDWPLAVKISDIWSVIVTYQPTYYPPLDDVNHTLKFGANLLCGSARQFSIYPAFEVPLGAQNSKDDLAWKASVALSWAF